MCLPRLKSLHVWFDPTPREGYVNMAIDELLLRRSDAWLRFYGWARSSVSYGYFDTVRTARRLFPGAEQYIRRWTGGGVVDHRHGFTYTLTLPAPLPPSPPYPRSLQLYEWIHGALAGALRESGVPCRLLSEDTPDGGRACWASPVKNDITGADGRKLAGAAQRRHRGAVLHQGLIQQCAPISGWQGRFASALAVELCSVTACEPWPGFTRDISILCAEKYCAPAWEDESHGRRNCGES